DGALSDRRFEDDRGMKIMTTAGIVGAVSLVLFLIFQGGIDVVQNIVPEVQKSCETCPGKVARNERE
ncbi:MAG: hypothetical protein ACTSYE_00660, partial [Alphaproteobacteria bacterium]